MSGTSIIDQISMSLSPQVLDQKYFAVPKELCKFSLVTMLTLDAFGRPSESVSVTP